MSAERLRQAADRLDELAEAATGDRWGWRHFGDDPDNLCRVVYYPPFESGEQWQVIADDIWPGSNAAYIAAMHPIVGKALAAWLRVVAERIGTPGHRDWHSNELAALDVADAILGGTP